MRVHDGEAITFIWILLLRKLGIGYDVYSRHIFLFAKRMNAVDEAQH